jgi:anaerobic selenocysteine-containing dehydrogenase
MDATTTGGQAGHCALVLMAICGNLDVPGGQTLGLRSTFLGKWRYDTAKYCEPGAYEEKRIGVKEWPGFAAGLGVAQPDEVLETLETDKPYPIRMSFFQSSNFLTPTCCVVPQRWYDALTKLEFNVITDLFMNPCAVACCDIFLPVCASIEHVGIVTPHFGRNQHFLGAMNKVLQVGECKSDLEIMIMLGKRINPVAWPWDTPEEFFDDQLKLSYPFGWEELSEMVYWQEPFEYHKYETGKLRPDGQPGFNTATGKCELKSTIYPLLGEEDPLPYFKEPVFSPYSTPELWKSYPFVLTTGARKVTSFHSEHRQNAVLREIDPWPQLEVNPEDAAELGITEDCWVAIENWLGQARLKAKITPTIHRHVVHATHGWWYPEQEGAEPNLFGNWKSNINSLMPHKLVNMLGLGSIHKDMICKVYKVEGLEINDDLQHRKVAADYVGNGVPENYRKTKGQVTFKMPVD